MFLEFDFSINFVYTQIWKNTNVLTTRVIKYCSSCIENFQR